MIFDREAADFRSNLPQPIIRETFHIFDTWFPSLPRCANAALCVLPPVSPLKFLSLRILSVSLLFGMLFKGST